MITSVGASDGAGHYADPEAVAELEAKNLGQLREERFVFSVFAHGTLRQQALNRVR